MNQERYWRNLIADEIKAEHDKVKTYYQKRGMNNGGMSPEEHTRLNIFLLSESIARTMRNSEEYVENVSHDTTPVFSPNIVEPVVPDININNIVEGETILSPEVSAKPVKKTAAKKTTRKKNPIQELVKDTPQQNEFGELL
jgi:hypothetical protein